MAEENNVAGEGHGPLFMIDENEVPETLPDDSWSTDRLIEAVTKNESVLARSNAVMLLAKRGGQEAVEAMIGALKDPEELVRTNAMVKLSERGAEVEGRMIEALKAANEDIRASAAWILGELKSPGVVEHLQEAAKDESTIVRIQARASLMAMGVIKPKKADPDQSKEGGQ
ncbi:MAG: HEAT repeat domain-containing protein [Methanotrichaceae archaeon]|nr:HEAT repeat domain-containing protein [Methanotrichaceae archaeon]